MAEDTYEAPSDSYTEYDMEASIDVSQTVESIDDVKRRLLLKIAASSRGQGGSTALNAEVESLARQLEGQSPVGLDQVVGRWALSFCSTQLFRSSPFWMAGRATCADGKQAERYDWFCEMHRKATMVSEIGAVRQLVTPTALVSEFETTVAGFPMRVGGAMPVTILGSIVSSASIVDVATSPTGALEMALEMGDVEIKGSNLPLVRQALDAGLKLDSRALNDALPIDRPKPLFTVTYVDDDLRVSRDCDANLYVYVKESNDPTPTTYDDVAADLGIPGLISGVLDALRAD